MVIDDITKHIRLTEMKYTFECSAVFQTSKFIVGQKQIK